MSFNVCGLAVLFFFFSSRRRHTRSLCDWSSDVCSSDLERPAILIPLGVYLLSPLTMPDLGIWSSAMESVPLQLATFMALSAHLRYVKSGPARHLTAAGFFLAFGLAFFEKGLVLHVLLFAVTAAYFADRSLIR